MKVFCLYLRACLMACALLCGFAVNAADRSAPVSEPGSTAAIEKRLDNIERTLQNQGLVDMLRQLQQLQSDVTSLRGQVELNSHDLENLNERQRKLFTDIDNRLQKLEQQQQSPDQDTQVLPEINPGNSQQPAGTPADSSLTIDTSTTNNNASAGDNSTTATATTTEDTSQATNNTNQTETPELTQPEQPPAPNEDPLQVQTQYQDAFNLLKQSRYDDAITAFNTFLNKYPDSPYSDNAQYWIGEAYYVTRRFDTAITEYMKVVSAFPQSPKVPNSLLKIGYCYLELGRKDDGQKVLNDLISKYPGTSAAQDAQKRLANNPD